MKRDNYVYKNTSTTFAFFSVFEIFTTCADMSHLKHMDLQLNSRGPTHNYNHWLLIISRRMTHLQSIYSSFICMVRLLQVLMIYYWSLVMCLQQNLFIIQEKCFFLEKNDCKYSLRFQKGVWNICELNILWWSRVFVSGFRAGRVKNSRVII